MSLALTGATLGYDGQPVVHALSVEVRRGEVLALVGPNGSGKSTALRALSGVLAPWQGKATLDGVSLRRLGRRRLARAVAVVQQGGGLPEGFRVAEVVAMGRSPHLGFLRSESEKDRESIERAMRSTGVWELRDRSSWELSGGEAQRAALARALAQEPNFLLLDEPTAHLDLRYQVEVLRHVRRLAADGMGLIVVLHDLNLAWRACDRVVVLAEGRSVAAGAPAEVLDVALLREVYGTELELLAAGEGSMPALLPLI